VTTQHINGVAALYHHHHAWLQGWLQRRLGNTADAADLAHDAFLRLIKQPRHFDSVPQTRSYLRRMADGLCVDLWRRRNIEAAWLDTLRTLPEAVAPSVEHQAIVLETLVEIDAWLRRLPARTAQAFVMTAACGMTYAEVGQTLGVSVRMVTKYVAQATLHCLQLDIVQAQAPSPPSLTGPPPIQPHPHPRIRRWSAPPPGLPCCSRARPVPRISAIGKRGCTHPASTSRPGPMLNACARAYPPSTPAPRRGWWRAPGRNLRHAVGRFWV